MQHPYQVAVPTYRRPTQLAEKTLPLLLNSTISPDAVTLYTHQHDPHLPAYQDIARATGVQLVTTTAGSLVEQRHLIHNNYEDGTRLAVLDDDLRALRCPNTPGARPLVVNHPDPAVALAGGFAALDAEGLTMWGINPADSMGMGMRHGAYTTHLLFCIGQVYGIIVDSAHPAQAPFTVPTKEDYEHTLRRWWYDGGVVRLRCLAARSVVYDGAGGLQGSSERTAATNGAAVRSMVEQWGGGVVQPRPAVGRGGYPEMLLKRQPRHAGQPWGAAPMTLPLVDARWEGDKPLPGPEDYMFRSVV